MGKSCRGALLGSSLAIALATSGCASSSGGHRAQASSPAPSSDSQSATATSTAASTTASTPASTAVSTVPSIVIPPNLCAATDVAQNTADAYLGALSAGDEAQALKCVLPHTVPSAVTHSLVARVKDTAVYLPMPGADGPRVFGYRGDGKIVNVTVTREADGKYWVTKVVVH